MSMQVVGQLLKENWLVLLVMAGIAAAWIFLRTPSSDLASTAAFEQQINAGRPVVVEFYSNT